jgi:hypothetical protein
MVIQETDKTGIYFLQNDLFKQQQEQQPQLQGQQQVSCLRLRPVKKPANS